MTRADPEGPDEGAPSPETARERGTLTATAWRLMSASTTLLVLGLLVGAFLLWAAFIPSDLARGPVAEKLGFGAAELIFALGAHAPLSSWLFWLLLLLMVLNLLGKALVLRSPHATLAIRATVAVPLPPDAIPARVDQLTGGARFMRAPDGQSLVLTRGPGGQGAVFIALGLATLVVALVLQSGQALEARLTFEPGDLSGASHRTHVTIAGVTVERALPYQLLCNPADPLDHTRTLGCLFRGPEQLKASSESSEYQGVPVILRPGATARVGEVRLTPLYSDRVRRRIDDGVEFFWTQPESAEPRRVSARIGQALATEPTPTGQPLTFSVGESGGHPWLVEGAETPRLWWPTRPSSEDPLNSDHALSIIPSERVTVRLETTPFRWLLWLGFGLAIAGLLLWALVADLTVTVSPAQGGHAIVTLSSTNRPQQLALWVARLQGDAQPDSAEGTKGDA